MERIVARRDLAFLLYDWLQVERLDAARALPRSTHARPSTPRSTPPKGSPPTCSYPHNRKSDLDEPHFDGEQRSPDPGGQGRARRVRRGRADGAEHDEQYGGMQLPLAVAKAASRTSRAPTSRPSRYAMLTAANANLLLAHGNARADRRVRAPTARGPLLRHDVPVGAAGRLVARRRRDARGCRRRSPLGRTTGSAATRCGSRAASTSCPKTSCTSCWRRSPTRRHAPAGTKGISLFIVPKHLVQARRGRACRRRAQRRRARRAEPQDGLPRHDQLPAQFRRRQVPAGRRAGAVGYLVGEAAGASPACST